MKTLRQSALITRTARSAPQDEVSLNAQLLTRGGFVSRLMAGVYSYLPLGARVLTKVENIVREEMSKIGSQEVLMPALQPKDIWDTTGRWDSVDVLFKLKGAGDRDFALGATHEEVVTPLVGKFIQSYRDLPKSVFQVQTKFRNEARAKSGILRGREFRMKDMYSFHTNVEDLNAYYEVAIGAYMRVFSRCGIGAMTFPTLASGGVFTTDFSHEFQTITPFGEDVVHICDAKGIAINSEIFESAKKLPEWQNAEFREVKAIEVGNIFKLGTKFSDACGVAFTDEDAKSKPVPMGCYGIGTTRLMGAVVEILNDEKGMKWPEEIAPFSLHLVSLFNEPNPAPEELFEFLKSANIETLYDDRLVSPGEKLKDADLIGLPYRVLVSPRNLAKSAVEVTSRFSGETRLVPLTEFKEQIRRGVIWA